MEKPSRINLLAKLLDGNSLITQLDSLNRRVIAPHAAEKLPVYSTEDRKIFDLLAINCLSLQLGPIADPLSDVLKDYIAESFDSGMDISLDAKMYSYVYAKDLLQGKISPAKTYQFLNIPFRTEPLFRKWRAVAHMLLTMSVLDIPKAEFDSGLQMTLSTYAIAYSCIRNNDGTSDLDANSIPVVDHLRRTIEFCCARRDLPSEEWLRYTLSAVKEYSIVYLATLLSRNNHYPEMRRIPDKVLTDRLAYYCWTCQPKTSSNPQTTKR